MTDTALKNQLVRLQFLLLLAVSCLIGLDFGRDYGGETFFAIVSFVALGVILLFGSRL
jgi:hypothetical protein